MVNVSTILFVYYAIIIVGALIIFVNFKIYVNIPYAVKINWPAWRYLSGGAIIVYYKSRNLE